jgi:16S rRNA (cytosine1402-N4)-methyltransferase
MNGLAPAENSPHRPVMVNEVRAALMPADGELYVDGTFGAGGYARAFLEAADCRVIGIDRDPTAVARGRELARNYDGRLAVIEGRFSDMERLLAGEGVTAIDGVAFDLGVSSMQLDRAERGFSFRFDGPLDMRMGNDGPTAADVVNGEDESDLANIIYEFGEERLSRRIARAIVEARANQPITRTLELAAIIEGVIPVRGDQRIHPATRTFQALRIHVNAEMEEIEAGLRAAERLLRPNGRLAVVAFHSLEDRVVKRFLAQRAGKTGSASRHMPEMAAGPASTFRLPPGGVQTPGDEEIAINPRSRSARLRSARRTDAPAWAEVAR